jgi:hypothetical protein
MNERTNERKNEEKTVILLQTHSATNSILSTPLESLPPLPLLRQMGIEHAKEREILIRKIR